jgi:hypothetical protein
MSQYGSKRNYTSGASSAGSAKSEASNAPKKSKLDAHALGDLFEKASGMNGLKLDVVLAQLGYGKTNSSSDNGVTANLFVDASDNEEIPLEKLGEIYLAEHEAAGKAATQVAAGKAATPVVGNEDEVDEEDGYDDDDDDEEDEEEGAEEGEEEAADDEEDGNDDDADNSNAKAESTRAAMSAKVPVQSPTPTAQAAIAAVVHANVTSGETREAASNPLVNDAKHLAVMNGTCNSSTHNKEHKAFDRECRNRERFPAELAANLKTNKNHLFTEWLKNGQDLKLVALKFKRSKKLEQSKNIIYGWRKEAHYHERYKGKPETVKAILQQKVKDAQTQQDPDCPDDPSEVYYYTRIDSTFEISEKLADETTMEAEVEIDAHDALCAMADGGQLAHGVAEGKLFGQISKEVKARMHVKAPVKRDSPEVVPVGGVAAAPTKLQQLESFGSEVLSFYNKVNLYAIQLSSLPFGKDLAAQLSKATTDAKAMYDNISAETVAGDVEQTTFPIQKEKDKFKATVDYFERQLEPSAKGMIPKKGKKTMKKKAT